MALLNLYAMRFNEDFNPKPAPRPWIPKAPLGAQWKAPRNQKGREWRVMSLDSGDLFQASQLLRQGSPGYSSAGGMEGLSPHDLARRMNHGESFLAAKVRGQIIGLISWKGSMELQCLQVDDSWQGRGVARDLIQQALWGLRSSGVAVKRISMGKGFARDQKTLSLERLRFSPDPEGNPAKLVLDLSK